MPLYGDDQKLMSMASTLPRLDAVRFFVWGNVQDSVVVPPLPVVLPVLRARIIIVFQQIKVWTCYVDCGSNLVTDLICAESPGACFTKVQITNLKN